MYNEQIYVLEINFHHFTQIFICIYSVIAVGISMKSCVSYACFITKTGIPAASQL